MNKLNAVLVLMFSFFLAGTPGCATRSLPLIDQEDGRCTRRAGTSQVEMPCTLSVISYNTHGITPLALHQTTQADEKFRSASVGWLIRDYDLALLQEDFEFHDVIFDGPDIGFRERGPVWPRWSLWPLKLVTLPFSIWPKPVRLSAPYGSGLTIAASALEPVEVDKYGIATRTDGVIARQSLKGCNGWLAEGSDCLSTKGILGMELRMRNDAIVHVYTVHLDAGRNERDRAVRRHQLAQVREIIESKSSGRALIVAGDFNIEFDPKPSSNANPRLPNQYPEGEIPDNLDYEMLYLELLEPLGLLDTDARPGSEFHGHRVDWVFYRGTPASCSPVAHEGCGDVEMTVLKKGEDQRFRHPVNRERSESASYFDTVLSDHPALAICFLIDNKANRPPDYGAKMQLFERRVPFAKPGDPLHVCRR